MGSWLAKAIVQRGIGALPNPHYWNELLQDRVTHSLELTDERFEDSLRNCRNHLEQLRRYGPTAADSGFSVFELGTGWFPVVPIGLFLCGAREVWTWDVAPLLRFDRLKLTMRRFLELEQSQGSQDRLRAMPEQLAQLRQVMALCESPEGFEPAELLERLGIYYRIGNASRSGLPPQSVDLIVSDVVFEYLSPEELFEILQEFRRIAAPDAVMSHTIDLGDQYATYDSGITKFNFLRFSDRLWRWLNNPIIPLNRLRISDYRRAFSERGFQVVAEISQRGDPAELARTPLAARFRGYSIEDLLVSHTWLVAIPQP
jgi:Methyltransferase domain